MAENSKIEWTDHTVNFWWGCSKVSPACAHCYAEGQAARFHPGHWGPDAPRRLRVKAAAKEALRYERQAVAQGRRFRVFANSMADFFEDRRDLDAPRLAALDVIRQTPHLDWLILTKRPEKIRELLNRAQGWLAAQTSVADMDPEDLLVWITTWLNGIPPATIWLGTTVEDQERADLRIPALLQVPARIRFLSCEPLLGPVDLLRVQWPKKHRVDVLRFGFWSSNMGFVNHSDMHDMFGQPIQWVICGGESGPHAQPMRPDWARGLRDQCAAADIPFLFKQWGEFIPLAPEDSRFFQDRPMSCPDWPGEEKVRLVRVGKKAAGRLLDAIEHNGYPRLTLCDSSDAAESLSKSRLSGLLGPASTLD